MQFSNDIDKLKNLILKNEQIENILVCTGKSYHVVSGSFIDLDGNYIFHFEGFSFHLEIDEIVSYIVLP